MVLSRVSEKTPASGEGLDEFEHLLCMTGDFQAAPLAAHDAALGADAATVISELRAPGEPTFEHASSTFMRALVEEARTVVATTTGYVGDAGGGVTSGE
jgi:2C-methyl-D-erythritol 2,4-cyclodiphosphate synthase